MKKTLLFILTLCLCASMLWSCGTKPAESPDTPETKTQKQTEAIKEPEPEFPEILCDFGNVVTTEEGSYFWQYSEDSFEYGGYYLTHSHDGVNELVFRDNDGELTYLASDHAWGEIALMGDRIYYTCRRNEELVEIKSCDTKGKDMKTLGVGMVVDTIEDHSGLICKYEDGYFAFSTETFQVLYNIGDVGAKYLGNSSGMALYAETASDLKTLTVYGIGLPDGEVKPLYTTEPITTEGVAEVTKSYIRDSYAYIAYGAYAGTGNFYQGGKIARIALDGSGAEVVAGNDAFVDDNFYLTAEGEVKALEVSEEVDGFINNYDYQFDYSDGTLSFYIPETDTLESYITEKDYGNIISSDREDIRMNVEYAQLIGNLVYFDINACKIDYSQGGWRGNVADADGVFLVKNITTGEADVIFEY